jgi:large subunit ribosomal protein L13
MKTYSQKSAEISRKWYLIDASESTIGRVSTVAASLLIGKGKPTVTHHMDGGDYVVIINANNVGISGNKLEGKFYYRHSGYPGGISKRSLRNVMEKDASEALFKSIRGMLPVNKLRDGRLERLKIYNDDQHKHAPQNPEVLSLKKGNK